MQAGTWCPKETGCSLWGILCTSPNSAVAWPACSDQCSSLQWLEQQLLSTKKEFSPHAGSLDSSKACCGPVCGLYSCSQRCLWLCGSPGVWACLLWLLDSVRVGLVQCTLSPCVMECRLGLSVCLMWGVVYKSVSCVLSAWMTALC